MKTYLSTRSTGFTLVELMVVIAILGVLVAIAIPSYGQYILRTHRVDATQTLQQAATMMEKYKRANGSYKDVNNDTLKKWGFDTAPTQGTTRFNITVSVPDDDTQSYVLQADATGPQLNDKKCLQFKLHATGYKEPTNSNCWN